MIETIIVGLVVAVAFAVSGRYLFREVSGGKAGCAGCGDDCPLAGTCASKTEAVAGDHAPPSCPITTGHAK